MTSTNARKPSLPSNWSTAGTTPGEASIPADAKATATRYSVDAGPRGRVPPCDCVEKMTLQGLECVGLIHENPYNGRKVALMRNRNADCSRHEKVIAKIWPNAHLDATRQALGTRDVESRMKKLVVEDAERESILLSQLADDGSGCAVRPLKTFTCQPGSEPVLVSTGCQSGATYFVREYCNYGDLSQYVTRCQDMYQIEGSRLGLRWYLSAKEAVRQAIECIKCVHDAGYALLDVDTSQFGVMDFRGYGSGLELDGPQPIQVKIIDAGQATALSTNSGSTIGKPSTRCPEAQRAAVQAERGIPPGERKHWSAERQDTWAVGLMIFDLLWNSPWQLACADDPQYRLYRERGVRTLVKRLPSSSNRFGVAPRGIDMVKSLRDLLRGTLTACDKPGMFLSIEAVLASPWWQESDHACEGVETPTTTTTTTSPRT